MNFCPPPVDLCAKKFITTCTSLCFCVIALQIYREILKKYRKGQKLNLRKPFLDSLMGNVMTKFISKNTFFLLTSQFLPQHFTY